MDFTVGQVDMAIDFVIRHTAEDRAEGASYARVCSRPPA